MGVRMPDNQTGNMPPEGYTEDEMGLFVDPDGTGPHAFDSPAPPLEIFAPADSAEEGQEEAEIGGMNPRTRRLLSIVGILFAVVIIVGGIGGLVLFQSAKRVQGMAENVRLQASTLKDSFFQGNEESLRSTAAIIDTDIADMQKEISSPIWSIAEGLPFLRTDISNVKTIVTCADDLSDRALMPLVDGLGGIRFADLMQGGRINTEIVKRMREAVVSAAPVIVEDAGTMANLPTGSVGQVNDVIDKLRDPLGEASTLLADADGLFSMLLRMLGDEGQTRNYILLAQTNSEIRSGGGFPGSIGVLKITDGNIELSDFSTIYGLKEAAVDKGVRAGVSDEEYAAYFDAIASDAAAPTFTPNFRRSGEIIRDFWTGAYDERVDGVFGLDPIFVQRMLGLTGGIIAEDGTEVNGENAAFELLSNVYWRYGYDGDDAGNAEEDAFFTDVANRAADKLLESLGNVDFEQFLETVTRSGADHRLQVWMADGQEQAFVESVGISGKIQDDIMKPELGVYANDNTWSKISWYLDIRTEMDDGVRNEDGTTTYHVTAHFVNNISEDEAWSAPIYVYGSNPLKQNRGDSVDTIYIMAPLGATIGDFEIHPTHEGEGLEPVAHVPVYERDMWRAQILIAAQGDSTCTFTLTMPPEVTERPTVRTSPLCHE